MPYLIHFIHADPTTRSKYEAVLRADGVDFDLVYVPIAGPLSSSYAALADSLRVNGRILPQLRARWPGLRAHYDEHFVLTYSAGYKFVEAVLASVADRDALAGVVAIDSIHAALDGDGTASDRQIAPWVDFAMLARDSRKLLFVGHSDVATSGYASTTQTAAELARLAGGTGGLFRVRAYDVRPAAQAKAEHGAALTEWGPAFVAEAFAELGRGQRQELPTVVDFGLAFLEAARADLAAGVREVGGQNLGPAIEECLRPFGLRPPQHWCAARLAWWLRAAERATGQRSPIAGSPGAKATMAQMIQIGRWTPVARLRAEAALLERVLVPGAILVWHRGAPGAATGHIGVLEEWTDDDVLMTIEANSGPAGDRVARMQRLLDDPLLLGAGTLSDGAPRVEPTAEELEHAARLLRLSDEVMAGRGVGLDAIEGLGEPFEADGA